MRSHARCVCWARVRASRLCPLAHPPPLAPHARVGAGSPAPALLSRSPRKAWATKNPAEAGLGRASRPGSEDTGQNSPGLSPKPLGPEIPGFQSIYRVNRVHVTGEYAAESRTTRFFFQLDRPVEQGLRMRMQGMRCSGRDKPTAIVKSSENHHYHPLSVCPGLGPGGLIVTRSSLALYSTLGIARSGLAQTELPSPQR